MNTQKGFASILIILLAVVAIGGGVYVYDQKNDLGIFGTKEDVEVSVLVDENVKSDDGVVIKNTTESNLSEDNANSIKTTVVTKANIEGIAIKNPVAIPVSSGQNCGSILDSHILFESDKRTISETNALSCLSKAILSCSPATLSVTGDDSGSYQVFSKNGENCTIGSTIGQNNKCEVPLNLISRLERYSAKENEPIENLIAPITFIMAFGEGKDTETGETFSVSCQSY